MKIEKLSLINFRYRKEFLGVKDYTIVDEEDFIMPEVEIIFNNNTKMKFGICEIVKEDNKIIAELIK